MIFGSGGDVVKVGESHVENCPVCGQNRSHQLTVAYRYYHIMFLFGFVFEKQCIDACLICSRGPTVPFQEAVRAFGRNPIPLRHRQGWWWLVAPIIVLFIQHWLFENRFVSSSWLNAL